MKYFLNYDNKIVLILVNSIYLYIFKICGDNESCVYNSLLDVKY